MAPSAWLKRLCSAPGKTRKVKPSWWIWRRRWSGRLATSAVSRASARMKPWMGSRSESKRRRGIRKARKSRKSRKSRGSRGSDLAGRLVPVGLPGEGAIGAEHADHLHAALQDGDERERAVGERLGQER